jgi:Icc-related predicted phosphoesterase
VRIAAAGDVHCRRGEEERTREVFAQLRGNADLLLLAGDLTAHGEREEAEVLAAACADLGIPVVAVLGNHDWHLGQQAEITRALAAVGVCILERSTAILDIDGVEVGICGLKGFIGGFADANLPDFGEPLLRRVYAETSEDVEALDRGLRDVAACPVRVVLLHYSPSAGTLAGEPVGIWAFLGSDRLAAPIAAHTPDLVLHGHAHAGTFEARIGPVSVYNVSVPVMGRDFWTFELKVAAQARSAIH